MLLAVRKEEGRIPGGGFHYLLMPMQIESDFQAECFRLMGHIIIEVPDQEGERLIKDAGKSIHHQCEVAVYTDAAEAKQNGK